MVASAILGWRHPKPNSCQADAAVIWEEASDTVSWSLNMLGYQYPVCRCFEVGRPIKSVSVFAYVDH